MTLSYVRRRRREKERREGNLAQLPGGPKVKRKWASKMVGLYREEQPSPLGCRAQGRRQGMPARRVLKQVGTEGCWENLTVRIALIC